MHKSSIYAILIAAIFVFSFQTVSHSNVGGPAGWGSAGDTETPQPPKTPGEHVDDSYAELNRIINGDSTFGEYKDKNEELDTKIKKDIGGVKTGDPNSRDAQSAVGLITPQNPVPTSNDH